MAIEVHHPVRGWRYWRVHFTHDAPAHWVNIDCGERVTEKRAVMLAERAYPTRGFVTGAVQDFERSGRTA